MVAEMKCEYCDYHKLCTDSIERHNCEIKEIDARLSKTETTVAVFDVELRTAVKDIAAYMKDMNVTVNKIQEGTEQNKDEIKSLSNKIDSYEKDSKELKSKVDTIDSESKVNTRTWLRDNFGKLFGIVAVGSLVFGAAVYFILDKILK